MKFNTAIATLMALVNDYSDDKAPSRGRYKSALDASVAPFAPHIAEELWEIQGFRRTGLSGRSGRNMTKARPIESEREIAVQVGGKLKTTVMIPNDADDDTVLAAAVADEKIARLIDGKEIVRKIVVKNKLINLIVK